MLNKTQIVRLENTGIVEHSASTRFCKTSSLLSNYQH